VILQKHEESPLFCFPDSALSEALQKGHQLLGRAVSARSAVKGFCLGECLFFEFKTRMKINLRRVHSFVPEPQSDDGTINAALEQIHRRAVSQDVRGDSFVFQRRTLLARSGHMFGEQILNSVSAQRFAAHVGKERIERLGFSFTQPGTQRCHCFLAQWNAPDFASFPSAAHMGARVQSNVLTAQTDDLRES